MFCPFAISSQSPSVSRTEEKLPKNKSYKCKPNVRENLFDDLPEDPALGPILITFTDV
jgi:hypothetical protein